MQATATGHWKSVLKKMPADELFRLEENVAALKQNPAWAEIVGLMASGREAILASLTTAATTKPYGDQCRALGHIAGLEEAPNIVQAILDAAQDRREKLEKAAAEQQRQQQEGLPR